MNELAVRTTKVSRLVNGALQSGPAIEQIARFIDFLLQSTLDPAHQHAFGKPRQSCQLRDKACGFILRPAGYKPARF